MENSNEFETSSTDFLRKKFRHSTDYKKELVEGLLMIHPTYYPYEIPYINTPIKIQIVDKG